MQLQWAYNFTLFDVKLQVELGFRVVEAPEWEYYEHPEYLLTDASLTAAQIQQETITRVAAVSRALSLYEAAQAAYAGTQGIWIQHSAQLWWRYTLRLDGITYVVVVEWATSGEPETEPFYIEDVQFPLDDEFITVDGIRADIESRNRTFDRGLTLYNEIIASFSEGQGEWMDV